MSQNSRRTPPSHGETRHSAPRPRSAAPLPLPAAASCLAPPRATQQTTQKRAFAPPRTCRAAPIVVLRVEDMPRASLCARRRRATLTQEAAASPRAKATIGAMRGAWRVAVVWVLSCMGSEHAHCLRNAQSLSTDRVHAWMAGCHTYAQNGRKTAKRRANLASQHIARRGRRSGH